MHADRKKYLCEKKAFVIEEQMTQFPKKTNMTYMAMIHTGKR